MTVGMVARMVAGSFVFQYMCFDNIVVVVRS